MAYTINNVTDNFPKYYQIEVNVLKGLYSGDVIAQLPVASTATFTQANKNVKGVDSTAKTNMIANGHIVSISADGIIDATENGPLCIVYSEPYNRLFDGDQFYATNLNEEHLRLVILKTGDEWTTDMELDLSGALAGRIVEITSTTGIYKNDESGWFANDMMPDGVTPAHHYMFIK